MNVIRLIKTWRYTLNDTFILAVDQLSV